MEECARKMPQELSGPLGLELSWVAVSQYFLCFLFRKGYSFSQQFVRSAKAVSLGPINQAVAGCHQLCSGGRHTDPSFLGCRDFRMHEGSENVEGSQSQWSFFNFQGPGTLKPILAYNHFPVHSPGMTVFPGRPLGGQKTPLVSGWDSILLWALSAKKSASLPFQASVYRLSSS